jgi:hypothetical protein
LIESFRTVTGTSGSFVIADMAKTKDCSSPRVIGLRTASRKVADAGHLAI